MTGRIYCISNSINDKVYIGKTVKSIEERYKEHIHDSKKRRMEKRPLYSAMNKYGIENFHVNLVEEVELNELENREQYWIKYFKSYHNGYNATKGGDGKFQYDYNALVADFQNGMTIRSIAEKYHCTTDTVSTAVHSAGFTGKENQRALYNRKILQLDKNGNLIQTFESVADAARYLMSQGSNAMLCSIQKNVARVVAGARKFAYGYMWKEANDTVIV